MSLHWVNILHTLNDCVTSHLNRPQKVYPSLADGISIEGGVNTWALSASFTEIIPANTIAKVFDITFLIVEGVSDVDVYEIVLYKGTAGNEVEIGRARTSRMINPSDAQSVPIETEPIVANSRISAKVASKTGGKDILSLSLFYLESLEGA